MWKIFKLPRAEQLLVLEAMVFVVTARVLLWVRKSGKGTAPLPRLRIGVAEVEDAERVGWAVAAVARRIPGASCLTQALAGRELLRRRGIGSEIRIGVAVEGGFRAHAWLVRDGQILLGGPLGGGYTEMGNLPCH